MPEWQPSPELADRIDAEVASFLSESTGEDATDGDDLRRLVCLIAGLACNQRAEAAERERDRVEELRVAGDFLVQANTLKAERDAALADNAALLLLARTMRGFVKPFGLNDSVSNPDSEYERWLACSTSIDEPHPGAYLLADNVALMEDKARLDGGVIAIPCVGGSSNSIWRGNLRAAIDAAKESSNA